MTKDGAGAQNGTSLANAWANTITWGTGAGAVGRGDYLYLCGTTTAPVTVSVVPSGVGAFDGTANAASDIVNVSGDEAYCGTRGIYSPTGNGINVSGQIGLDIGKLIIYGGTGGSVNAILGASNTCVSAGYPCIKIHDITCYGGGTTSGHCTHIGPQAITTFPTSPVQGLIIQDVFSFSHGGAACTISMSAMGAVIDSCHSSRDAIVSNTWGVYQSGVVVNCGTNGTPTWTQVSGFVYRTPQTGCGAATGKTILAVSIPSHATGVVQDMTQDTSCIDDASCTTNLSPGEWNQVGDTLYVNRGTAIISSTATVYLIYAWNTNPITRNSESDHVAGTFDGIGIGLDFGVDGGVIERSYSHDSPAYNFSCGGGSRNCMIRSSITANAGIAGIVSNGTNKIYNVTSIGNSIVVNGRTSTGETLTIKNVGGSGVTSIYSPYSLSEGAVIQNNNSTTNPLLDSNYRPLQGSPLCKAGTWVQTGLLDYDGIGFKYPPAIGAFECRTQTPFIER